MHTPTPKRGAVQDPAPQGGVRCPTPGCDKLLMRALAGRALIQCRHCDQVHVIDRDDVIGNKEMPTGGYACLNR